MTNAPPVPTPGEEAGREAVLTVASDPKHLRTVRALACAAAHSAGFDRTDANSVCLAVDEACTNVIRHAYLGDPTRRIEIRFRIRSERIDVTVRDWGRKVDPSAIQPRDLADVRPGGLGVHFIREIMDEVTYDPGAGDSTELRMTRRRPAPKVGGKG